MTLRVVIELTKVGVGVRVGSHTQTFQSEGCGSHIISRRDSHMDLRGGAVVTD